MSCTCHRPVESVNPRHVGHCVKCSKILDPAWTTNESTFEEFMQRLEEGIFHAKTLYGPDAPGPPRSFLAFKEQCRARFLAGQEKFGLQFLERDNPSDAQEEAADLANYAWMELLRARQQGDEEEWSIALTAAYHAAQAHEALAALRTHDARPYSEPVLAN